MSILLFTLLQYVRQNLAENIYELDVCTFDNGINLTVFYDDRPTDRQTDRQTTVPYSYCIILV